MTRFKDKLLSIFPFLVILILVFYTWGLFVTTDLRPMWKHVLTLSFIIFNIFSYFKNFKVGMVTTGVIILLSMFNVLSFFAIVKSSQIGLNINGQRIYSPKFQWFSILLLIFYTTINLNKLTDWYIDYEEKKKKN